MSQAQNPVAGAPYIPTEEEKRVFRECNNESFWYRSLPFSAVAMAVAQVLVSRGVLVPSPRFGSLPKLAAAGLFGYVTGKISYTKVCQEKFKNLENSPLGDALRQGKGLPQQFASQKQPENQSEMGDPNQASFDSVLQSVTEPHPQADSFSYSSDSSYRDSSANYESAFNEPTPTRAGEDINPQVPSYMDDDTPKKKSTMYEDLRSKNRENYEVTMTQKADTLLQPPAEKTMPKRDVKKNQYGDAWDE